MNKFIILLVLVTALGAAEIDTPKPVPAPPVAPDATQPAPAQVPPAATTNVSTPAVPAKRACGCDAAGGRAALLARPAPTTSTPVASPSP